MAGDLAARLGRGVAVALLVLLAAGCASGGGAAAPGTPTRTITDIEGTQVQVPVNPQRVITLSEPTLDGTLALGVSPIGLVAGRGQSGPAPYLAERAGDVPVIGRVGQPDLEAIGQARPDLILVDGTGINNNPPLIALLRRIAPVVVAGYAGGDWRVTFGYVANALNRVGQGQQVLAAYDARVAELHARLGERLDETYSIVRWQGNSASMILKGLPAGVALTDLGLHRPPNQDQPGPGHSEPVSLENLQEIDADWMFFGTLGGSSVGNQNAGGTTDVDAARAALAAAEQTSGFTDLRAFRNDRIVLVDGAVWTTTGGPLLMNRVIDDVQKALVKQP